ncbi:acyl-CoA dehydrogenase family protein [Streptomyces sp. Ag109_O5-10]|uniref:acyl-CoA dehydrogenase family protein n=1 Tax=Streptomyces sp. Ag109_O5-10 TaxID=1855349 RepID=UPI00089BBB91|nr:acyl-CoA dehydrogenase family protein [Streptomyces sp. Ag109_O5-10]SEF10829.1 Acyl-CoA dehydrogenase, N-terminal domain [Streptomyces sp. Ag109_O5-10]
MRFLLDTGQRDFADALRALLTAADTPAVIRDWSRGEQASGRALWGRVGNAGVFGLAVPEEYGGAGRRAVELAVAFVELGRFAVPGPLAETVAAAVLLDDGEGLAKRFLPGIASGGTVATVAFEQHGYGFALDADAADVRLAAAPEGLLLSSGAGAVRRSLDPARRLAPLFPVGELLDAEPPWGEALTWARLATAAQALGVGLALLDRTVAYVKRRNQFGVPVGSFQAVRHRLADVKIALEFARPLVFGAAVTMTPSDVAAAKLSACAAAYAGARAALQLHGAIGYTAEYDLSLWLTKARALRGAWGAPEECRAVVLGRR